MNRILKTSADDLLIKSAIFVTVFMSGGVHVISPYILAGVDTLLLLALYIRDRIYIDRSMYQPFLILSLLFVYIAILSRNYEDMVYILFRGTQFGLAFLIVNYFIVKRVDFIGVLNGVLLLFLAHGILNFIFINIFSSPFTQTTTRLGTNLNTFLIFQCGSKTIDLPLLGVALQRNLGLFGEPGICQIYMNILFFINVFIRKNYRIAVLALIMVVSTFSTVGFIILLIQVFTFLRYDYKLTSLRRELLLLAIVPLLVGMSVLSYFNFKEKFVGQRRGSFDIRVHDIRTALGLVCEYPWGIGFSTQKHIRMTSKNSYFVEPRDSEKEAIGTNSIMTVFYSTGVVWGGIIMYCMYKQRLLQVKRPLVFIVLVLSLSSQPLFYNPFFLLFPISAMVDRSFRSNGVPTL